MIEQAHIIDAVQASDYIENHLHFLSVCKGLENAPDDIHEHDKADKPTPHELELAAKKDRNPRRRKLMAAFFKDCAVQVTAFEKKALGIFGLPDINELRGAIAGGGTLPDDEKPWEMPPGAVVEYRRAVVEFGHGILGEELFEKSKQAEEYGGMVGTYPYYELNAFTIGIDDNYERLLRLVDPDSMDGQRIRRERARATADNPYYRSVVSGGGKRIKTHLALEYMDAVILELKRMAKNGKGPIAAGYALHDRAGEGALWYWMRLTRSESALGINAGFNYTQEKYGVPYERFSAGPGACMICSYFGREGMNVWPRGQAPQPCESTHPHCHVSSTKIYTLNGWERIDKIKLNDMVLTHMGQFKRVTQLHRHTEKSAEFVKLVYKTPPTTRKNGAIVNLALTVNHPVLINGEWKEAGQAKAGEKIRIFSTRCIVCGKLLPYSTWRTVHGEKIKYCSTPCRVKIMKPWMSRPKNETVEIRKKISEYKKQNNPMHRRENIEKMRNTLKPIWKSELHRTKLKRARREFIKKNPDFAKNVSGKWKSENPIGFQKAKEKQSKSLAAYYKQNPTINKERQIKWQKENPILFKQMMNKAIKARSKYWEEHPGLSRQIQLKWQKENPEKFNAFRKRSKERGIKKSRDPNTWHLANWRRENPEKAREAFIKGIKNTAKNKWITAPQKKLYEYIKEIYPNTILNMPIKTNVGLRFGDVVLPDERIILEYDGAYWHQDKNKELQRDLELQFSGWTVLHFNKENWETSRKQVSRLIANHNGLYEFIDIELTNVKCFTKKHVDLYNLSVQDDESYIAKGFVVHNCLCHLESVYIIPPDTTPQPNWTRSEPYTKPYTKDELRAMELMNTEAEKYRKGKQ